MLVLSRKRGERIRIGENIVVTLVAVGSNAVRIGIDAPKDVLIMRTEIEMRQPPQPPQQPKRAA